MFFTGEKKKKGREVWPLNISWLYPVEFVVIFRISVREEIFYPVGHFMVDEGENQIFKHRFLSSLLQKRWNDFSFVWRVNPFHGAGAGGVLRVVWKLWCVDSELWRIGRPAFKVHSRLFQRFLPWGPRLRRHFYPSIPAPFCTYVTFWEAASVTGTLSGRGRGAHLTALYSAADMQDRDAGFLQPLVSGLTCSNPVVASPCLTFLLVYDATPRKAFQTRSCSLGHRALLFQTLMEEHS